MIYYNKKTTLLNFLSIIILFTFILYPEITLANDSSSILDSIVTIFKHTVVIIVFLITTISILYYLPYGDRGKDLHKFIAFILLPFSLIWFILIFLSRWVEKYQNKQYQHNTETDSYYVDNNQQEDNKYLN